MIAAPVGPVGVLCVRRTLFEGSIFGLASGLGAAVADALFGIVAAFGLKVIADFLIGNQHWLKLVGAGFLLVIGIRAIIGARQQWQIASASASAASAGVGFCCKARIFVTMVVTWALSAWPLPVTAAFTSVGVWK